jgi:hypothetical protein
MDASRGTGILPVSVMGVSPMTKTKDTAEPALILMGGTPIPPVKQRMNEGNAQ